MIFLDTNFIVALFIKTHKNHAQAMKIWKKNKMHKKITSKLVVIETLNILNVKLKKNIELSQKVFKFIVNETTILHDYDYHDKAMEYMKLYYPERIPFSDCVYMALMEDLEINKIASFDKHFELNKNIKRIH